MQSFLFRTIITIVFVIFTVATINAQRPKKTPTPACATGLGDCSSSGCSANNTHDKALNELKNVPTIDAKTPRDVTLQWMKGLKNPSNSYKPGGVRTELTAMHEGENLRTVGWLLAVKPELGGESCNCYLKTKETTDNHLVLITDQTLAANQLPAFASKKQLNDMFHVRELESVTVEFTPRIRLQHAHFTHEFIQPMLNRTTQGAMKVRITGQLMFDSEHFKHNQLVRVNNWELHPVYRFEYCPTGKACSNTGSANWVDIDN